MILPTCWVKAMFEDRRRCPSLTLGGSGSVGCGMLWVLVREGEEILMVLMIRT
jgi:hypothetical protein